MTDLDFCFILQKFDFLQLLEETAAYGGPDRDQQQLERYLW